ncbi:hypothetical protein [Kitasatospora aureofaciens]|uniref:hypothetical protein n=1 Tax=Kitasatospora aureofaciens TaxID=1894 RepID=UPI0037F12D2E
MSEPDKFEDDLLYAMTRTGEGFRTEQGELVAGGLVRGRRRWRRRSAAAVVSGAAALALVGTGAFYLSGSTGASPVASATIGAAAAPTATGTTGTATPTAAQSSAAAPISGDEVLATFQALLPKGQVTDAKGTGTDKDGGRTAYANLVFDDGQGKSLMGLSIQKHRKGQSQPRTCPADLKLASLDSCATTTLPDGSQLVLSQGYEYPNHRATTKEWFASLIRPDGGEIFLSEWNSAQEKGAPDSRPDPALTLDQLKAIVTDKSWDRVVAAVKYDGVDPAVEDPGLTPEEKQATLAKLLPAGFQVASARNANGNVTTYQVTGGQTSGGLIVRVDYWGRPYDDKDLQQRAEKDRQAMFKDATTLPDGTKVAVAAADQVNPKASPARVEVLRPDGLHVQVVNGPGDKPLFTLDQLKAIATSPEWKLKK